MSGELCFKGSNLLGFVLNFRARIIEIGHSGKKCYIPLRSPASCLQACF